MWSLPRDRDQDVIVINLANEYRYRIRGICTSLEKVLYSPPHLGSVGVHESPKLTAEQRVDGSASAAHEDGIQRGRLQRKGS